MIKLLYIEVNQSDQERFRQYLKSSDYHATDLILSNNLESIGPEQKLAKLDLLICGLKSADESHSLIKLLSQFQQVPRCILLANTENLQLSKLDPDALQFPIFDKKYFDHKKLQEVLQPIAELKEKEAEYYVQETRLKNIEEANCLYLTRTDKNGNYTYVNDSYQEAFLGSNYNAIGDSSLKHTIAADQHIIQEIGQKALRQLGQVFSVVLRKPAYPDGRVSESNWEFMAIANSDGKFTEIQGIGYQIAADNKIALTKIKAEQELVLKNSGSLNLLTDRDLEIKAANGALNLLHCESKKGLAGKAFTSFILAQDKSKWTAFFERHIRENPENESLKIRLLDIDKRVFWTEIMMGGVFEESDKVPTRYLLSLKEIKPDRQLEKEKNALLVQSLETLEELKALQKALDKHALVAIIDTEGNFLYVNNFYAQTSGYTVSELIGQPIRLLQSDFYSEEYYHEIWETIKNGKVWHGEQRNKRKDGSSFWVKNTISPRFDESTGEIVNYINILTDISNQKFVEKELVYSQNKLYNTINSINQELWSVNTKYELTIFNKVFFDNFKHFFDFDLNYRQNMVEVEVLPDSIRQSFKYRYDRAFKGEFATYYDNYFDKKEQKVKNLEVRVMPTINEMDEISGATIYSQDITERKEQEKELKELLIRFELATKSNNIGIWDYDIAAEKLIWDENMFTLYEMPNETEINWDEWAKVLEPESLARVNRDFAAALKESANFEASFKIKTNDGHKSIASLAKIIRNGEGKVVRAIGLNWDITKTVEYEENLEQSLKEKEEILNSIHDGFLVLNQNMEVLSINKSACSVLNIKEEEVIGKSLWPTDFDKQASEFYPAFKRAFDTQISTNVEGIDRVTKNWIDATIYPNENGVVIFFKDVTIEKIKSIELEKVRNNQSALINTTDDLIWSLNTKLELVAFNEQFCQHQLNMGALMPMEGRIIFNQHSDSYKNAWKNRYEKALAGTVVKETISEANISFSLAIYPIINAENETEGIACYAKDITDMEAYLHAIEKQNNELKDIAWMQSHIVRAPVARILGLVELIHDEKLDQDHTLKGYISSIYVSAQELDNIVEKISEKTHSAKIKGI